MKVLKAKEVIQILLDNGFFETRSSGSHIIFRNKEGISLPVPVHGKNNTLSIGTFLAIIKQSKIPKIVFEKR